MTKFSISGMACAACSSRVENVVSKVPGVEKCSVNLLTSIMTVEGKIDNDLIIQTVLEAGYGATLLEEETFVQKEKSQTKKQIPNEAKNEAKTLLRRFLISLIFLLPLIYISMGHSMLHFPIPSVLLVSKIILPLLQFSLSTIILFINKKFFINGAKAFIHKSPNMDTLVSLGSGVSYLYSIFILILILTTSQKLDFQNYQNLSHSLYFESASMILVLITFGKILESLSKGKTTNALKSLMSLAPKTVTILSDEKGTETEKEIPVENVNIGDIFIVKPGNNIGVDGIVIEGNSSVNESSLTGESLPIDKKINDKVKAGTLNINGFLKCRATRVGKDTTFSQIIKMVSESSSTIAPVARIADKVSGVFVPFVMGIAFVTFVIWLIFDAELSFALTKAVSVLVVSCPCALGLATPVAIMVANGVGAKNGILFKTSTDLENTGKTKIVALDKTGTITKGKPEVVEIISFNDEANKKSQNELLQIAYTVEEKSEHPLAKAIVNYSLKNGIQKLECTEFTEIGGRGIKAKIIVNEDTKSPIKNKIIVGNLAFINENFPQLVDNILTEKNIKITQKGQTPLIFASCTNEDSTNGKILGIICLSDKIKDESKTAIKNLQKMGVKVIMLSGDNENTAKVIAKQCGISSENVIAPLLPEQKQNKISELKEQGFTCMVGDGINDAPSLVKADIGIAIGDGSDVALDAANIVLVKNNLCDVEKAIRLSKKTLKNIHENLFWAFIYNIILIPLAAGVYHKIGLDMSPMLGAFAMSLSSFCVVMNALRLNLFK